MRGKAWNTGCPSAGPATKAIEEQGVKVGRAAQVAVGPLDHGHGAALTVGQAAVDVAPPIPRGHRVGEDAQHLAQQLAVEGEREAQREG